jgi:hypothetical protein
MNAAIPVARRARGPLAALLAALALLVAVPGAAQAQTAPEDVEVRVSRLLVPIPFLGVNQVRYFYTCPAGAEVVGIDVSLEQDNGASAGGGSGGAGQGVCDGTEQRGSFELFLDAVDDDPTDVPFRRGRATATVTVEILPAGAELDSEAFSVTGSRTVFVVEPFDSPLT